MYCPECGKKLRVLVEDDRPPTWCSRCNDEKAWGMAQEISFLLWCLRKSANIKEGSKEMHHLRMGYCAEKNIPLPFGVTNDD